MRRRRCNRIYVSCPINWAYSSGMRRSSGLRSSSSPSELRSSFEGRKKSYPPPRSYLPRQRHPKKRRRPTRRIRLLPPITLVSRFAMRRRVHVAFRRRGDTAFLLDRGKLKLNFKPRLRNLRIATPSCNTRDRTPPLAAQMRRKGGRRRRGLGGVGVRRKRGGKRGFGGSLGPA